MRIERNIEGGIEVEHEVEVDSGGPVLISKRRVVQPGGDMDVGINRADYIHSSDRGACTFRSSNPHLSRAKPAPSYLRVSHRGRWILSSPDPTSVRAEIFRFLLAIDPPLLTLLSHRDNGTSSFESRERRSGGI